MYMISLFSGKNSTIFRSHVIFLLTLVCFMLVQVLFYYFIGGTGFHFSVKWLFFSSLLFTVIAFLFKRTAVALICLFLYTLVLHINILYFRFYNALIPPDALQIQFRDLLSLTKSGLYSLRTGDLLLYLPCLLLFGIFRYSPFRSKSVSYRSELLGAGLLFLIFCGYLYPQRKRIQTDLSANFGIWRPTFAYQWFGYPAFLYYNLYNRRQNIELDPVQVKYIHDFLQDKKFPVTEVTDTVSQQNLLFIIVESLETFPLGKTVEGQEITPFLNRLIRDTLSFYAPHVVTQVKDGMSSDGQLMLNTGLLPLPKGAACYLPDRTYLSLARILKSYNRFSAAVTILGHSPGIWNQAGMCTAYGYDKLYSQNDFDATDAFNVGMSDLSLFRQAVPVIRKLPQPFLVQLITVSSHTPFRLPEDKKRIHISPSYHPDLAGYLESINYTDYALSVLFHALEENDLLSGTSVVLTGDHYAFADFFRKDIVQTLSSDTIVSSYGYLPLIVYNSRKRGQFDGILGQIDIFPSLLDLFHFKSPWQGVGNSIFRPSPPGAAAASPTEIVGGNAPVDSCSLRKAWQVSEFILRGNYLDSIK